MLEIRTERLDVTPECWAMVVKNAGKSAVAEWEASVWWLDTDPAPSVQAAFQSSMQDGPIKAGAELRWPMTFAGPSGMRVLPNRPARDLRAAVTWKEGGEFVLSYQGETRRSDRPFPQPWTVRWGDDEVGDDGRPDLDALVVQALDLHEMGEAAPDPAAEAEVQA